MQTSWRAKDHRAASETGLSASKANCRRLANIQDDSLENCFLLRLDEDLLLRCWPGECVTVGVKVCKILREKLAHHPSPQLFSLQTALSVSCKHERAAMQRDLSFNGLHKDLATLFRSPPSMHLAVTRIFPEKGRIPRSSEDIEAFSPCNKQFRAFLTEFLRARLSGWEGPCSLDMYCLTWDTFSLSDIHCHILA